MERRRGGRGGKRRTWGWGKCAESWEFSGCENASTRVSVGKLVVWCVRGGGAGGFVRFYLQRMIHIMVYLRTHANICTYINTHAITCIDGEREGEGGR